LLNCFAGACRRGESPFQVFECCRFVPLVQAAVALYWAFSAAVSALPDPASGNSPGYQWLFRFLHTLAGNITTALNGKAGNLKALAPVLVLLLLLPASACATAYRIHPGALNQTDSVAYDSLLAASSAIDQARADYKTHQLPEDTKGPLNALIHSYNVARDSWLTYRGAISTNVPSATYFDQLNNNLTDLTTAIRNFTEAK